MEGFLPVSLLTEIAATLTTPMEPSTETLNRCKESSSSLSYSTHLKLYYYMQIYIQLYGIVVTTAWSAVMTYIIYVFIDKCFGGIRVPEMHEAIGLDIASHGQTILAMPKKKLTELIRKCDDASQQEDKESEEDLDLDVINHGDGMRGSAVTDASSASPARTRKDKPFSILVEDKAADDDGDEEYGDNDMSGEDSDSAI